MSRSKKVKLETAAQKAYKFTDRRGENKASSLYPTTNRNPNNYRPRYYTVGDTPKVQTAYDRLDQITLARGLFSECPDLGGAILQKNSWVVSPGAFTPISLSDDTAWADKAETWLTEQFFPVCSTLGPNYPFSQILFASSVALDVDGDTGMYFTKTRTGFPQIGLVPGHRIGCRSNEKEVTEGKFSGYRIVDGVILNDNGRPIGYRILGDTKDDDLDISIASFQLLFDGEWQDQIRGISKIARSVLDWADQSDINEFIKRGVKMGSSIGLISKTEDGNALDAGANIIGAEEDAIVETANGVAIESIHGGEFLYLKSGANETIEALKDERPSPNTEAFMNRIQKRAMYSIGWPQQMMSPETIGGASVRLIQDLVRKTIATRQAVIERRARLIVNYAIARAMNQGYIPQNNKDWYRWTWTKGSSLVVDGGNEATADREGYKLGSVTLSEMSSKKGMDWYELRKQQQTETEDLLDRAQILSKKYDIPMTAAVSLLSQRTSQTVILESPTDQDNSITVKE